MMLDQEQCSQTGMCQFGTNAHDCEHCTADNKVLYAALDCWVVADCRYIHHSY